jgi:hypothetical protein
MRKIIDGSFVALGLLTLAGTDYADLSVWDIAVFACLTVAAVSTIILVITQGKRMN